MPDLRNPSISHYDGTTLPDHHLWAYRTYMVTKDARDEVLCRMFPLTLEKEALVWFQSLPANSIDCYNDLVNLFMRSFQGSGRIQKTVSDLFLLKQQEGEPTQDFLARFNKESLQVHDKTNIILIQAFRQGLLPGDLSKSLAMDEPATYVDLLARARRFIKTEEGEKAKRKQLKQEAWNNPEGNQG